MSKKNLDIVYQGWLIKSPPEKKILKTISLKLKWRTRWFVLHQNDSDNFTLSYYRDSSCMNLKGNIDLNQCEQVNCGTKYENCKAKYQYMFDIKTPQRTYYLVAESEENMKKWVHFLQSVGDQKLSNDNIKHPLSCVSKEQIHVSSTINEYASLQYTQPNPDSVAESVYNDVELNKNNLNTPPIMNWLTHPGLAKDPSNMSETTSSTFNNSLSKEYSIIAPPRPPKPTHLLKTLGRRNKLVEPLNDDYYDFPRSHQVIPSLSQSMTQPRHYYKNAPPSEMIAEDTNTYKFKTEEDKTPESEYMNFTNFNRTPPPVNRLLKPKFSEQYSCRSNKLLPLPVLTNPPIVDQSVKPFHYSQKKNSFNVNHQPIRSLSHEKSSLRSNIKPTHFEHISHYSRIDLQSSNNSASNRVLSRKGNTNLSNTDCTDKAILHSNKHCKETVSKNGNSMDNADYTFTTINFFKTTALAITRQTVEQERNKLYNN